MGVAYWLDQVEAQIDSAPESLGHLGPDVAGECVRLLRSACDLAAAEAFGVASSEGIDWEAADDAVLQAVTHGLSGGPTPDQVREKCERLGLPAALVPGLIRDETRAGMVAETGGRLTIGPVYIEQAAGMARWLRNRTKS